jgi:putative membrane protein
MISHRRYFLIASVLYAALWILLAIEPHDRSDWALENALVVAAAAALLFSYKRLLLSRISYTLIFIFLGLHAVGAHWTYSLVPYDQAFLGITGYSFNGLMGWERNQYDRIVHFAFGLLLAYPVRELFLRVAEAKGFWGYFLPLALTMAASMLYELAEWWAAELFGGDLGVAFLGTQGDVWDPQKDMWLATLGALIAMGITAAINIRLQIDFAREWSESLTVKQNTPLGEDELARMLRKQQQAEQGKIQ